jgi:uncharacterized membrane protein
MIGIVLTIGVSLIPPSILKPSQYTGYVIYQVTATVVMIGVALVIYKCKKPEWKKENHQEDYLKQAN